MNVVRKWIVAHRGDTSVGSENTLAAFQAAISAGADMIELDVQRLADGVLVVFHDAEIGGEQVAKMDSARLYERALALGLNIPTLTQTLDLCAGRIRLDVELKNAGEDEVLRAFTCARLRVDHYLLTSFDPAVLANIRKTHPGVRTGLLTENTDIAAAQDILDRVAADFWAPDSTSVNDAALARCEQLHVALLPWGVNRDDDMRRMLSAKSVAGIITDRTRDALDLRRKLLQVIPEPGRAKSDKSNV
jgi:glycerophosphoryl diester phosphodiesterase